MFSKMDPMKHFFVELLVGITLKIRVNCYELIITSIFYAQDLPIKYTCEANTESSILLRKTILFERLLAGLCLPSKDTYFMTEKLVLCVLELWR